MKMRKLVVVVSSLAVLAIGVSFAGTASAIPFAYLVGPGAPVLTGASFSVEVRVDDVDPGDLLLAFGFDVSNGAGIILDTVAVGGAFSDDSGLFPTTQVSG